MTPRYTQEEYNNAKSEDLLPLQCEHCGKIFKIRKKLITHELKHNRGRNKYCSHECANEAHKTEKIKVHCSQCGKEIEVDKPVYESSESKHFFCSHSCSAKYNNTHRVISEETKKKAALKTSVSLKNFFENQRNEILSRGTSNTNLSLRTCVVCGKKYFYEKGISTKKCCSKECSKELRENRKQYLSSETIQKLHDAGYKSISVQGNTQRSKNEMYFCQLCENYFKKVKHNVPQFNGWDADVIIEDIKYAVMWNGIWHFKNVLEGRDVKQTQNRDKIKIKEIEKCGYTPYIIEDFGGYNPKFVENEFEKLIKTIQK